MVLLDKIIIGLLCLFFLSGWLRGFLKALIGPISFLLCFIAAVFFYDLNRNILMAIVIATVGTLALTITWNIILIIGLSMIDKEFRGKLFPVSRILGSALNLFWQGNIMFAFLVLLFSLPIQNEKFETLQNQVPGSQMIAFYYDKVINRDVRLQAIVASFAMLRDPQQIKFIVKTKEYKTFLADPILQKFINDPIVIDALEAKDSWELLKSDSLRELVTNDVSMYNFTLLVEMLYQKNLEKLGQLPADKPTT